MKNIIISLFALLGFCFNANAEISDPKALFLEGNKYYDSNHYEQALEVYNTLLEENYISNELHFNIGNCYYKQDNFAKAILYFEKAKKQAPNKDYIIKNLALARTKITDNPERSRMGVVPWVATFFGFTTDFWAWISIVCLVFALVSYVLYKRFYNVFFKKAAKIKCYVFLGLFMFFVIISSIKYNAETNSNTAIVMDDSVTLKTNSERSSENAFVLNSGSKIVILQNQNNWSQVRFGANVGWIKDSSIEKI